MLIQKESFSDLPRRAFSATVFSIFAFSALYFSGYFTILFLCFCNGMLMWEVFNITNRNFSSSLKFHVPPICLMSVCPMFYSLPGLAIIIIIISALLSFNTQNGKLTNAFCALYIGVSFLLFYKIFTDENNVSGFLIIMFIISVVVSSDIGGYFSGRVIGGAKVWKRISPNKTWSGLIGGWVLAMFSGYCFSFVLDYEILFVLILSFALAVASQVGDFFQSSIKRYYDVKDSGFILSGHGGLFDRFDGLLLAVPTYFFINLTLKSVVLI